MRQSFFCRSLLVWLVLSSLAAYRWPLWVPIGPDPFLLSAPWLWLLITVTMFSIGWMLPRDEVRQLLHRWPAVLGGTALQYVTMPLLAYLMARACGLSGEWLIGMVMVGSVPGAMASNVLTFLARGNTSYSVSLTTSATLFSPLAVPIALALVLRTEQSVDRGVLVRAGLQLLGTVVLPVLAGYACAIWLPRWRAVAERVGPTVANLAILWIIAVVVAMNRDRLVGSGADLPLAALLTALIGLNLGGYAAGYLGSTAMRLPEPMRRALTLEVGMQNAGLGAYLASALFDGGDAIALAPALYTFGCMLTGTLLASYWSRIEPAKKGTGPFCRNGP
jgi:bile acid:Na+ symporter, BASS family